MPMDLQQLRYFSTVAKMENVSHAAACHYIPQSAMSRVISRLEKELGVKLFNREHNKITLNDRGREFAERVDNILLQLDEAVKLTQDDEMHPCGEIYLLTLQYRQIVSSHVADFKKSYPHVTFHVSHQHKELHQFEHGLCISSFAPTNLICDSLLLAREELLLAVSKEHPLANAGSVKLTSLRDAQFLILSNSNSLWKVPLHHCHKYGFELNAALECNDIFCLWQYLEANIGIAFLSPIAWSAFPLHNVSLLRVDEPNFYRDTYLFWPRGKSQSPTIRLFANHLAEQFHSLQGNLLAEK